ncbi:hypothetical protein [Streptomyces sp. CB01881]|uniref:hypothetical protein n=1 Tax=Streptomyces sp. CB01881 TaxID=2078691 RepID=UPI000CDBFC17|nr:hypothetical protein [Streptomyces sp. CB01881]AUY52535.1 hypothetical protein C2142_30540 [Streptomyces sp. CB01881]TYC70252.1 hypothetical protein EH183_30605 [Streptomyces sp. CB01881]
MSLPDFFIQPVVQLLAQTASPYDVPADPEIFNENWLEPTLTRTLALLREADPEKLAATSVTGSGLTYLSLASDVEKDYSVHLRIAGEGKPVPRDPAEKAVVLTLGGTMELEAYRHGGDVESDTPWYVRQFTPENIYACHPGTLHSVEQSEDAVQLVISRGEAPAIGRPLDADEYRLAAERTRQLLDRVLESRRTETAQIAS